MIKPSNSRPLKPKSKSKPIPSSSSASVSTHYSDLLQLKTHKKNGLTNPTIPVENSTKQTTLLVESFHQHQRLDAILDKLRNNNSNPSQLLKDYGDWDKLEFWAVVKFLRQFSCSHQIIQVFDVWTNIESSRMNEYNYNKIIGILSEEGLMEDALLVFRAMNDRGARPSLDIYNLLIHGFAKKGMFDDALPFLREMEKNNIKADSETYDGLIQAYGKFKMYDEMGKCVKKMESSGCAPDHITYNLLIQEFSRAGLLKRMEKVFRKVQSKKMDLQSSTLFAMLEAYADYGILENMEKMYRRVLKSKMPLKENLIRKLASVYIENHMFSRLDDLAVDLSSSTGDTNLVWYLRLLSHACLLSRKGMDFIIQEMDVAENSWTTSIANILLLAFLKMKDFKHLKVLLAELPTKGVKPDLVTVGVLFDASSMGFGGSKTLKMWQKMGLLGEAAQIYTDPLIFMAFGKGCFLRSCEETYSSLEPKSRGSYKWNYQNLINLVFKQKRRQLELMGLE
ncbi:Pentacotripeptide-repeat region of PRORP [Dillenia turbinata]|uniref:Pentacotripeptide-repeat region of PRORP n=1 Tax=Dillenia turbinata TaxID=194707 RepID=A0AAN8YVH3_9MAGN